MTTENKTPVVPQTQSNGTRIAINVVALVIVICASFATGILVANLLHDNRGDSRASLPNQQQFNQNNSPWQQRDNNNNQQNRRPSMRNDDSTKEQKDS